MSISSVGNSDAYARYRHQAVDLLAPPVQKAQASQSKALSYVALPDMTDQSDANHFATKFKTDLSMLNGSNDGKTDGAHGHHSKADTASQTSDSTTTTDAAASTDPLQQTLNEFVNLLKTAAGIAAVIA